MLPMANWSRKLKAGALALAVLAGVGIIFSSLACSPKSYSGPIESITVAYSPFESTALLWVAKDQRYFQDNGLSVSLRKYDTGAASLAGLANGEAAVVVGISEFPVVRSAFQGGGMRIIANADKGEFIYLVGRNDRGIQKASDLKGKKIGTAKGTISEYYLGRFLELNGMAIKDIDVVDLKTPQEWVNAVVSGDIDAVVTAQPDANTARERLGPNGFIWPVQSGQFLNGLIVSTNDWLANNPGMATRFLKAMIQAERYFERNPDKAKAIVKAGLNLDAGYVNTAWTQNQFTISLDQSLVVAMEDEARWIIGNNLTSGDAVPNFLDLINADSLKIVDPGSVRISGK